MYDYTTPEGYGDYFFVYNVNGEDIPLVNGGGCSLQGITITDADFVCRQWSGASLLIGFPNTTGTCQVYDGTRTAWFQLPILQGVFPPALAILPEKVYRVNSNIRFDITNATLVTNNNGTNQVYADQMAFYGVRRFKDGANDPIDSNYTYREEEFSYPFIAKISNYGPTVPLGGLASPTQYTIQIQDFDFELRRIHSNPSSGALTFGVACSLSGVIIFSGLAGTIVNIPLHSGINTPLSVTLVGNTITIILATNGAGAITTTITQLVAAVNAIPSIAAILTATVDTPGLVPDNVSGTIHATNNGYNSQFKIGLYDTVWRQRSSIPILEELLCNNTRQLGLFGSCAVNAFWPCPPIMYQVNSVIRFDIYSLIPSPDTLPVFIQLLFKGVRRIRCG